MELKILLLILRELTLENVAGGGFGRQVGYLLFSPGIKETFSLSHGQRRPIPPSNPLHPHNLTAQRKGAQGSANPASHPLWSVCEDYPGGGPHGETRGVFLPYLVPTQVTVPESAALSELSVAVWCSIVSDSLKPHEL